MNPQRYNITNDNQALDEAARLQADTKAALQRMQQQAAESQVVAVTTLEELQEQRHTLDHVGKQTNRLQSGLEKTKELQDRLSRWTLTFNRRAATRTVKRERRQEERQQKKRLDKHGDMLDGNVQQQRLQEARERRATKQAWKELDNLPIDLEEVDTDSASSDGSRTPPSADRYNNNNTTKAVDTSALTSDDIARRLAALHQEDEEIDAALDGLGAQVDTLLELAKAQGQEVRAQDSLLQDVHDDIQHATDLQKTANLRAKGFLQTPRKRRFF